MDGDFPVIYFNSHDNSEDVSIIILMLNMKKLKHRRFKYIIEVSRDEFKSRFIRFKNSVLFPIGSLSQDENRF